MVRFDVERLKDSQEISQRLKNTDLNSWDQLKETLFKAANELASFARRRKHPWWIEDCDNVIAQRQTAWVKWNSKKTKENWHKLLEQIKGTAKII